MYSHDNGTDAENRPARPAGSNGSHTIHPKTARPDNTPNDAEFDALAGMFLAPAAAQTAEAPDSPVSNDDASRGSGARSRTAASVRIGALILGHLPVMASAWPAQHARVRVEESGEHVVIARLSRGVLTLESFGATGPAQPFQNQTEAISWAAAHAACVLIRVDEADEVELALSEDVEQLVFLTGTDDAAVVACYRKLKNIADLASTARPLPEARLTVVGADASRGRITHERIARAARAFLDAELLEPVIVDRVAPTRGRLLYRDETTLTTASLLAALRGSGEDPVSPSSVSVAAGPAEADPMPAAVTADAPPVHSEPVVAGPVIDAGLPTISMPADSATAQKTHAPTSTPAAPSSSGPAATLAGLVPGLLPLESACPVAPCVTLAYDAAGVLHLLAASLARLPDVSSETPVQSLLRAAAWARSHADLLKRAEPRLAADAADHAEMHLVTDRSRDALAVLDTPIRVHLAAPATPQSHGLVTVSLVR